ncbi:hypothetical protein [Paenibacillus daejeonensis]|uniref:hypothetical protein n=1 Tax=Paenibacillus daejeonensis TaxID=135193 RepID=UPI000371389B|nr:hypothetical protein [Paenibacillus daejeonensis]
MDIGRRIYYELSTGNVLVDTGERSGDVVETTQEQDFASYTALAERVPETVGLLELEYGELAEDFAQASGYRVDLETGNLIFSYREPGEETPPVYRPPLSQQVEELQAQNLMLMEVVADLYEMMLGGADPT